MLFLSALLISGAIVYLVNDHAGALLIGLALSLAAVRWVDARWFNRKPTR